MIMKPIQIFALVAALAANSPAQTGSQNTDPSASSTAKSQSQQQTGANSKKKDSKKPDAASGKTAGGSSQPNIKVIIPPNQATTPGSKNAGAKPQTPAATASKTPAGGKETGAKAAGKSSASQDAARKTAGAAGKGAQPATTVQKKQPVPVLAVKPSSKAQDKKNASTASTRKSGAAGGPFAGKAAAPRIVQKTPPKTNLVTTAKTTAKISSAGRRDPFVNPIRNVSVAATPAVLNCSTGKKSLAIAELTVQGTAKDTDGKMMAIVSSGNHRSYFLRENDQICNGGVEKITGDSVIFRESVTDNMGHQTTHEVVKKINPS